MSAFPFTCDASVLADRTRWPSAMGVDVEGNRLLYTGNSAKEKAVMR